MFEDLSAEHPRLLIGMIHYSTGDHDAAIRCFQEALEENPHSARCWNMIGWCWVQKGSAEKALQCFDRAIAEDGKYTMAWVNKGIVLKNLGEYEKAIDCYKVATDISGAEPLDASRAWYNLASVLWERGEAGDEEEARRCLGNALGFDPMNEKYRRLLRRIEMLSIS